jgi:hypothetical protein
MSVTVLLWRPGPAQGTPVEVKNGDEFLIAIRVKSVRSPAWTYEIIRVVIEGNYSYITVNDEVADFEWSDIHWYIPVSELTPPEIKGNP